MESSHTVINQWQRLGPVDVSVEDLSSLKAVDLFWTQQIHDFRELCGWSALLALTECLVDVRSHPRGSIFVTTSL